MKKSAILLLCLLVFSCSKDDKPKIPEGDRIISAAVLGWRNIGEICPAPQEVNGLADLEITFNGSVPSRGVVSLQSKWKLPSDPDFTFDEVNTISVTSGTVNGRVLRIANGFCWGLENSVISCEFKFVPPSGEDTAVITVPIPRPQ